MALGTKDQGRSFRFLLSAACVIAVIAALRLAQEFLIPVMVAFFLAQLSLPVVNFLRTRKVPSVFAVALTVLLNFLAIIGVVYFTVNLVTGYQDEARGNVATLQKLSIKFGRFLDEKLPKPAGVTESAEQPLPGPVVLDEVTPGPVVVSDDLREAVGAEAYMENLFNPQADAVLRWINRADIFGRLTSMFSAAFFVGVLMVFMLLEASGLGGRVSAIRRLRGPDFRQLQNVSQDIQKYLGIKTLVSAVTGTLAGILTWVVGVEAALLWGMVAFILNFIPAIGSIIAAVPPILIAIVQFYEPGSSIWFWKAMMVLGGYVAINLTLGNFIEPMLLGQRFGISTLVVLISVLFWGWMWGAIGMFLAVPLTMLVKVILDNSADFRWVAVAMGKGATTVDLEREAEVNSEATDDIDPEMAGDVVPGVRDARREGAQGVTGAGGVGAG